MFKMFLPYRVLKIVGFIIFYLCAKLTSADSLSLYNWTVAIETCSKELTSCTHDKPNNISLKAIDFWQNSMIAETGIMTESSWILLQECVYYNDTAFNKTYSFEGCISACISIKPKLFSEMLFSNGSCLCTNNVIHKKVVSPDHCSNFTMQQYLWHYKVFHGRNCTDLANFLYQQCCQNPDTKSYVYKFCRIAIGVGVFVFLIVIAISINAICKHRKIGFFWTTLEDVDPYQTGSQMYLECSAVEINVLENDLEETVLSGFKQNPQDESDAKDNEKEQSGNKKNDKHVYAVVQKPNMTKLVIRNSLTFDNENVN